MTQEQDQQFEKLLKGIGEAKPVEPSHFLYAKIRHKIDQRLHERQGFSGKLVLKTAVAYILLIALNFVSMVFYSSENNEDDPSVTTEEEYDLTPDNYYYNYSE
jgi:hypothetical protein